MGLNIKTLKDIMRQDDGVNGNAQRMEQIVWILFLKMYDIYEKRWMINAKLSNKTYASIIPPHLQWDSWAKSYTIQDGKKVAMKGVLTDIDLINFVNNDLFPTLKNLAITQDSPLHQKIVRKAFEDTFNYMKRGVLLRKVINAIDELEIKTYEDEKEFSLMYENFLKDLQSAKDSGEFYTPRAVTDFVIKMLDPKIGEKIADLACGTGGFLTSAYHYLQTQVKTTQDKEMLSQSFYGCEKKALPFILCATGFLINGLSNPNLDHANAFATKYEDLDNLPHFDIIAMNPPYGGSEEVSIQKNFPADLRGSETSDLFMAIITERLTQNGRCAVVLPDGFLFGNDSLKINLKKKLFENFDFHLIIRLPQSVFAPYTNNTSTNILFFDKTPSQTKQLWVYRLDMPEGYKAFSKTKPMKLEHFNSFLEWNQDKTPLLDDDENPKAQCYTYQEIEERNYNLDLCPFLKTQEIILPPEEFITNYLQEKQALQKDITNTLNQIQTIIKNNQ